MKLRDWFDGVIGTAGTIVFSYGLITRPLTGASFGVFAIAAYTGGRLAYKGIQAWGESHV